MLILGFCQATCNRTPSKYCKNISWEISAFGFLLSFALSAPSAASTMEDPITLASGIQALTRFTIQSTKTLHDVIERFLNKSRSVRGLKQGLEALDVVLRSLQGIPSNEETDLSV